MGKGDMRLVGSTEVLEARSAAIVAEIERYEGRGRLLAREQICEVGVDAPRRPIDKLGREYERDHLVGGISGGIEAADDGAHGCAGHIVDGYIVLLKCFDRPDVGDAFGAAAAEDESHRLPTGTGG